MSYTRAFSGPSALGILLLWGRWHTCAAQVMRLLLGEDSERPSQVLDGPVHRTGKGCSVLEISLLERHVLLQAICRQSLLSDQVLQFTLGFIHLFNSAMSLVVLFWHLADQEPKPFDYIRIVPASCRCPMHMTALFQHGARCLWDKAYQSVCSILSCEA